MLTHGNIFANVVQTETWTNPAYALSGDERYLVVIPYFHIYAFSVCMMIGLWIGALQIILPKYDPEQVLTSIRDFRPTYFPAVPTIFVSLLNHPKVGEYGLERVRLFNSGGAPCPVEVIEEFERRIGRPLNEGYGLSETSPVTHSTPQLALRKLGTIGLPFPDTDMKIVDVETGTRELPVGEAGELCIAGPQVMKGYWNKPEESAPCCGTDADGRIWFHTGDIARMDEDGYTSIVQRKKDMIIVDGFNVYPSEVESCSTRIRRSGWRRSSASRTRTTAKSSRPASRSSPASTATADEIIAFCRTSLTEYKVPRVVEVRDTLPMSAVGKILYRVLRDEHAAADQTGSVRLAGPTMLHEPRRRAPGPERPRVFPQDDRRRDCRRRRCSSCSASASSKSKKDASSSRRVAEERFYNGTGVAHGGFAATLLDTALGCAINSTDAGRPTLHDARAEGEPHAAADARGRQLLRCEAQGRPRRRPHRDVGRAHRRSQRQALRPRHDDVHRRRAAARADLVSSPDSTERHGARSMADLVRYEIKDGVAVLTIDNPPVNALSPAVWERHRRRPSRAASADPAAEAIVLIGAGTTFIAGADIKVFDTLKTREDSMSRSARNARAAEARRGRGQAARRGDSRQRARRRPRGRAGVPLPRRDEGREGRPAGSAARHHPGRRRHAAAAAAVRREDGARDVHRRQAGPGAEGARGRHRRSHRRRRPARPARSRSRRRRRRRARSARSREIADRGRRRQGRARGLRGDARSRSRRPRAA